MSLNLKDIHTGKISIKNVSYISLLLNFASMVIGLLYLIFPVSTPLWMPFGLVIVIAIFWNYLLVLVTDEQLNKANYHGNRINIICYSFLIFNIFAMPFLMVANLVISLTYSTVLMDIIGPYILIILCYFGIFIFGLSIAFLNVLNLSHDSIWKVERAINENHDFKSIRKRKIYKKLLRIFGYSIIVTGFILSLGIFLGPSNILLAFIGVLSGQFALFVSLMILSAMVISLKTTSKKFRFKKHYAIMILGIIIAGINIAPYALSPSAVSEAENNFSMGFGSSWRDNITPEVEKYFLQIPFMTLEYFLGIPPKDCIVREHISFFNDTDAVENGIELYFDAYLPPNKGEGLPGENSTIIRIHGGGWVGGEKGIGNFIQMSKYLAAQGYLVFDIQYGLKGDYGSWDILAPGYVKGDFTIDDMFSHIGIFIQYLITNNEKFGVDLESVFISGGSAGGHLACAAALAIANGSYEYLFGNSLTIKGLIPFYPANGMAWPAKGEIQELFNPELLIDSESPPCLIFQGTQDGLVASSIAQSFKDTYTDKNNEECAIIWLPLAGHMNELYFSGYYNQIFLYYMERFLYIYH